MVGNLKKYFTIIFQSYINSLRYYGTFELSIYNLLLKMNICKLYIGSMELLKAKLNNSNAILKRCNVNLV